MIDSNAETRADHHSGELKGAHEQESRFPPATAEQDVRWNILVRVLATKAFLNAPRLSAFLRYVGERSILDRTDEITEQQIGIHVFGRAADYNPGDDNVVRHTARQLRQRLALFYQEEGKAERLQILMPRGGYVLQFSSNANAQDTRPAPSAPESELLPSSIRDTLYEPSETQESELNASALSSVSELQQDAVSAPLIYPQARQSRYFLRAPVIICLALVFVAVTAFLAIRANRSPQAGVLWGTLFRRGQKTLVVPGDAGLNLYYDLTDHKVVLTQDYASKSYLTRPDAQYPQGETPFAVRRYTTMSDVNLILDLHRLKGISPDQIDILFARSIRTEDLKTNNAILIGAPNYDPWVKLFDPSLDFNFEYDNGIYVLNRSPQNGEKAQYANTVNHTYTMNSDAPMRAYAVLSLTDNFQKTGHILLIEGVSMNEVEAATDFLFDPKKMEPIIKAASDGSRQISNFDVLLEARLIREGSITATPVAVHIHRKR